jgi:hypothetical protein
MSDFNQIWNVCTDFRNIPSITFDRFVRAAALIHVGGRKDGWLGMTNVIGALCDCANASKTVRSSLM